MKCCKRRCASGLEALLAWRRTAALSGAGVYARLSADPYLGTRLDLSKRSGAKCRSPDERPSPGQRFITMSFTSAPPALIDPKAIRSAEREVARLQKAYPDFSRNRLVAQVIKYHCVKAGAIGGATTALGMIPAFGKLGQWALGLVGDAAATAQLQTALVLQVFALHERTLDAEDEKRLLTWIATMGAGGGEVLEQMGTAVVKRVAQSFAGRFLKRGLPWFEVTLSSTLHVGGTYLIGRRAQLYCQLDGDMKAVEAFEKQHPGIDVRRIANWVKLGLSKTIETAEGAGLSVMAAIRKLVSSGAP